MIIANATVMQVANAIGLVDTVSPMSEEEVQEFRRARLADLLSSADFGGSKVELGRALGYSSGAFIRQLLEGERPIREKTVAAIEQIKGAKFSGWFSQPTGGDEAELIAAFRALQHDETSRRLLLDMARKLAAASGDLLGGESTQGDSLNPGQKRAA